MTQLASYPSYRSTGAQWCPTVPAHWDFLPLRRVGRILNGGTPTADEQNWNGDVPFVTPPDLRPVVGSEILSTERMLSRQGAASGSSIAPPGSVLVSIRAPIGYVARATTSVAFNQGCRALVPNVQCDGAFLTYALVAAAQELDAQGRGTTFMEISAGQFAGISVPVPPPEEQRAVVAYLDHELSQIAALISKQQQLIERLRERSSAVRDHHYQRTEGKRQTTLRRILTPLRRPAVPALGVVTAFRDGMVTLRSNRREDGYTLSDTETGYQEVRPGDLVFHALDGFAGAVGIADSHGNATPVYHVCRLTAGDDPEYVALLLRYLGVSGFLATQAPSVRQRSVDFRNWETFARVPVWLPSVSEQVEVRTLFSEQSAKVNALVSKVEQFMRLAKERRTALIAAAATGQLDVRTGSVARAATA